MEEEQHGKQLRSGVRPSPVDEVAVEAVDPLGENPDDGVAKRVVMIGAEFDDDLFPSRRVGQKMTRAQKRANNHNHGGERDIRSWGHLRRSTSRGRKWRGYKPRTPLWLL